MSSEPGVFRQSPPPVLWQALRQEDPFRAQVFAQAGGVVQSGGHAALTEWLEGGTSSLVVTGQLQPRPSARLFREQLVQLQQFYAIKSSDRLIIETLEDVPVLFSLLRDAVEPLRSAFGEKKLLKLEAVEAPDEGRILRVIVRLPAVTPRPADLMRGFKRNWWLNKCARSHASLVFDYEIGNGF